MKLDRPSVDVIDLQPEVSSFRDDVLRGLRAESRSIPPKYFYDRRGSELFDEITRLPEYYLTRTETTILGQRAKEIAALVGPNVDLVEFGSGNSAKVRILLDRLAGDTTYMPVDISRDYLLQSIAALSDELPDLRIVAICADYTTGFVIPPPVDSRRRLVFFPGSTIGNFEPAAAHKFLRDTATAALRPGDLMVVGADLIKAPDLLDAAYNDSRGVTAEFNLNLLARINGELGGNFDLARWQHVAFYNEKESRIEMHLRSVIRQVVSIGSESFAFEPGDKVHTENSYKYSLGSFRDLLKETRFRSAAVWTDPDNLFSVQCLRVE
jgi:dimethylhistidine N-methyltransferase